MKGHSHSLHSPKRHIHLPKGHSHSLHSAKGHSHSLHSRKGHSHSLHSPKWHSHSLHLPKGHSHSLHYPMKGHSHSLMGICKQCTFTEKLPAHCLTNINSLSSPSSSSSSLLFSTTESLALPWAYISTTDSQIVVCAIQMNVTYTLWLLRDATLLKLPTGSLEIHS